MSISPEKAFHHASVLFPQITHIKRGVLGCFELEAPEGKNPGYQMPIDWGNTTQYPPPAPKFRDVVPADLVWPWPEIRVQEGNTQCWRSPAYLCSVMMDAEGKVVFGCTDGNTYKRAQIREKA